MKLKDKNILLAIGGSISAYKAPDLVRRLQLEGAGVTVMMSVAAQKFITALTLEAISGNQVLTDLFAEGQAMSHIHSSRKVDLILVAPTTANMLAKFSYGLADDLISATVLAANCPVLIAPAMNRQMWKNFLVQDNCERLNKAGYKFVGPDCGDLACGEVGKGRLASFECLVDEVIKLLTFQDLKGKKVLITAGPTREYLDPVRFLANDSSGKMGLNLIKEAFYRGADVVAISSLNYLNLPSSVKIIKVESAKQMAEAVKSNLKKCDVFIANAAVSDYRFATVAKNKIKKKTGGLRLDLVRNPDILEMVSGIKNSPFIVGFALETENYLENGWGKMLKKGCDLLVVNDVTTLGSDLAKVAFITPDSEKDVIDLQEIPKRSVALMVFNHVVKFI